MQNKIREIAKQKELSISSVIKNTGLSKSYVYEIINNQTEPSLTNSRKIAHVLGESLNEVFPEN